MSFKSLHNFMVTALNYSVKWPLYSRMDTKKICVTVRLDYVLII